MSPPINNIILKALRPEDRDELLVEAHEVVLTVEQVLFEAQERVEWVYFVERGLVSLMVATEDGRVAEAGMIGVEGALALIEACGTGTMSPECVVQVAGSAWRVSAERCRWVSEQSAALRRALWSQLEFQVIEARQSATCRSFHPVEARLARWLLESLDRAGGHDRSLEFTQEFLAAMLGVQRTTVSSFAQELQKSGLIRYRRGKLDILDRDGLESMSCECRQVLAQERHRVTSGRDLGSRKSAGA
jgi:CRP-like cAMP-binding protein